MNIVYKHVRAREVIHESEHSTFSKGCHTVMIRDRGAAISAFTSHDKYDKISDKISDKYHLSHKFQE